jgi:hypothetical protein
MTAPVETSCARSRTLSIKLDNGQPLIVCQNGERASVAGVAETVLQALELIFLPLRHR